MQRLTNTGQMVSADRQLVVMVCLQLLLVIIATIPSGIYIIYTSITLNEKKTTEQVDQEFSFSTVTSLLSLFNVGVSFILFKRIFRVLFCI